MIIRNKKIPLDNDLFDKISFLLLSIWIVYPIIMMAITTIFNNEIARNILYYVLFFTGFMGLIISTYYVIIKIINKEFKIKKYYLLIILIILLLWSLITCFTSVNMYRSFIGTDYRKEGFITYILYYGILLLGILLRKRKELLINELLVVEVILSIVSLMNNNVTYILTANKEPYVGIFSQFNHYGYYLMFGIISSVYLFITKNNKISNILYLLVYLLLLYTLILNDTFGCFLSILITIIFISIYYRKQLKKILIILLSLILICSITTKNNQNIVLRNFNTLQKDTTQIKEAVETKEIEKINNIGTTRGNLWKTAIKYSLRKPIMGYGIENLEFYYSISAINQDRPHNILIQFLFFTGIPGMLLYLIFIILVLLKGFLSIRKHLIDPLPYFIVLCYIISSMFGNSMFYTSPYYFIFLGLLIYELFKVKCYN